MKNNFETHKAKMVLQQDGIYIIDFRREDGSSNYYIRFIVDTTRSSVFIEGDLGHSISCWYSANTLANISDMMRDHSYWIEKFQCASNDYVYDEDLAREELAEYYDNYHEYCSPDENEDDDEKEYLINRVLDEFSDTRGINAGDKDVQKALEKIFGDSWWEIPPLGRKIHPRVRLWALAFDLALKQLNLKCK